MKNNTKKAKSEKEIKLGRNEFDMILERQEAKCALTGKRFVAKDTDVEFVDPYKEDGLFDLDNLYFITKALAPLASQLPETEIIHLCAMIISYRGAEFGYKFEKTEPTKATKRNMKYLALNLSPHEINELCATILERGGGEFGFEVIRNSSIGEDKNYDKKKQ